MATELVQDYLPDQAGAWDDLVARAVNGTMLHTRRYLAYHGDRFRDRSLLITNSRGWPIGALPAAEDPADASVVTSHPGLTYGGLVHDGSLRGASMMRVLCEIAAHYRAAGFARLHYKALPQIYQAEPAADDVHALYRLGASRSRCDLAAVINLSARGRVAASAGSGAGAPKRRACESMRDGRMPPPTGRCSRETWAVATARRRRTHWPRSSTSTTASPRRSSWSPRRSAMTWWAATCSPPRARSFRCATRPPPKLAAT